MEAQSPVCDRTLVIMAKAPRPGMVKTRLSACLPEGAVVGLYRSLLEDTIALGQSIEHIETAIMSPAADVEELSRIAGPRVSVVAQAGHGLGAALTSVFAHFARAGRRVVAFNSDSPHLPPSLLRQAFEALTSCDLVAGPTNDGGYYLVGASAPHPGLFAGDSIGTATALDALLARARSLALSVRFIDSFYDVDEPADLSRLAEELRLTPGRAPRTAIWLSEWSRGTAQPRAAS
jgi:rSAM/selenodomain-associated transferase 1